MFKKTTSNNNCKKKKISFLFSVKNSLSEVIFNQRPKQKINFLLKRKNKERIFKQYVTKIYLINEIIYKYIAFCEYILKNILIKYQKFEKEKKNEYNIKRNNY